MTASLWVIHMGEGAGAPLTGSLFVGYDGKRVYFIVSVLAELREMNTMYMCLVLGRDGLRTC